MVFPVRLLMLFLGMVSIVTGANITMAQAQSQGSQERPGSAQGAGSQSIGQASPGGSAIAIRGSSGGSSVRVVPFITISERYDSNIRLTTPKVYDYVTAILPGARMEYRNDLVEGTLTGALRSEVYVRNPELNFVGTSASIVANLDNAVGRMVRGFRLGLTDSMTYSPQPLAFVTPEAPETSLYYGIQVGRSNTLTNAANIQGSYAITPLAQFNASYSNQLRKFLDPPTSGNSGSLFNTAIQSFLAGPQYQVTPNQLIGASYQYQHFTSEPATGGLGNVTVVHGAMVKWQASLTRELTIDVSPGVSILDNEPEKPRYTMRGSLQWRKSETAAGLSYVRAILPGMFISSGTLISNVVTTSLSQGLTSEWRVSAQLSYAKNETITNNESIGQSSLQFESFAQSCSLDYTFYPGMAASVSVSNFNFSISGTDNNRQYDRQTAMISLRTEWN